MYLDHGPFRTHLLTPFIQKYHYSTTGGGKIQHVISNYTRPVSLTIDLVSRPIYHVPSQPAGIPPKYTASIIKDKRNTRVPHPPNENTSHLLLNCSPTGK